MWQGVEYLPKIKEKLDELLKLKDQGRDHSEETEAIDAANAGGANESSVPPGDEKEEAGA